MPDYAFTVFSCIGFLVCIPLWYFNWKVPGRPWATLILIGWVFLLNLLSFIDSIVWSSNDPDTWWDGKVYCDINSRIKSAFPIGVPGATIGICRFLAAATDPDPSQRDLKHTQTRRNMLDLFLGVILPIIEMPLKFIVTPKRYIIIGIVGCSGWTDDSWPSILLYYLWSPTLCLIASGYAGITIDFYANIVVFLKNWYIRHKRHKQDWSVGVRGISRTDFYRLVLTVLSVIFFYLPMSLYVLSLDLNVQFLPYSWSRVHGPLWKYILMEPLTNMKAPWTCWIGIFLAITLFFFVGFTRNAKQFYEHSVELIYDHLPPKFQAKSLGMQKISDKCKERRSTRKALTAGAAQAMYNMTTYFLLFI
jgi:pheromone a factor receptor